MPVVPYVRKSDSRGQGFSPAKPIEVPAADEPWMLMAAAQMDQQGRLVETQVVGERGLEPRQTNQWPGSAEDKQRAMNLLRRKSRNEEIEPESSKWLDGYMEWTDRTLPPIKGSK